MQEQQFQGGYEQPQQAYQQPAQQQPMQQPMPQQGYQQPMPQQPMMQTMPVQKSPFSASWEDIKMTPNWIKKMGFRGLVGMVPILNFCLYGYAGRWGQSASNGDRQPMPQAVVNGDTFGKGFMYFLMSLILGAILGVVTLVPFVGALVSFVAAFFITTILSVMYLRYLNFGSFGDAFAIKDIFEKMKRNFGQLWVATFVPSLIMGAIGAVLCGILMGIGGLVGVGGVASYGYYGGASIGSIAALISGMGIFFTLGMMAIFFAESFAVIWALRGAGIWCQQNVPEWNIANAQQYKYQQQMAQQQAQQAYQQNMAQQNTVYQQNMAQQVYQQQPMQQPVQQPMQQPVQQPVQPAVQQPQTQVPGQNGFTQVPGQNGQTF